MSYEWDESREEFRELGYESESDDEYESEDESEQPEVDQ
jgi:hypothetical protein